MVVGVGRYDNLPASSPYEHDDNSGSSADLLQHSTTNAVIGSTTTTNGYNGLNRGPEMLYQQSFHSKTSSNYESVDFQQQVLMSSSFPSKNHYLQPGTSNSAGSHHASFAGGVPQQPQYSYVQQSTAGVVGTNIPPTFAYNQQMAAAQDHQAMLLQQQQQQQQAPPPPPQYAAQSTTQSTSSSSAPKSYNAERVIGNGSFGIVYLAQVMPDQEYVAIKKVFQDRRYRNRELQILQDLQCAAETDFPHPNIIKLISPFHTQGDPQRDELFLNLVMEYMPDTLFNVARHLRDRNPLAMQYQYGTSFSTRHGANNPQQLQPPRGAVPEFFIMLYTYQLLRALAYLKSFQVMHRDIKPQNLLVDMQKQHVLKLCDFGSAKKVDSRNPSVQYICSRYYRAPELIFGSQTYGCAIDMWSAGCVMGELINEGRPIFPGQGGVDQLIEIVKVRGTPKKEELADLCGNVHDYCRFEFPPIKSKPLTWIMPEYLRHPTRLSSRWQQGFSLLDRMLLLNPRQRLEPLVGLADPYFDRLRIEKCFDTPIGTAFAPKGLLQFTQKEWQQADMLGIPRERLLPMTGASQSALRSTSNHAQAGNNGSK